MNRLPSLKPGWLVTDTQSVAPEEIDHFTLDDFRLRLDSPLFHRDPGASTVEPVSQLRGLTMESDESGSVDAFRAQLIPAAALPPNPLLRDLTVPNPPAGPPAEEVLPQIDEVELQLLQETLETLPPPVYHLSITPPSTPAVEAELNRLAFVPEMEAPLGPVELPAILTGDFPRVITGEHPVAAPFVPSLSQHEMYSVRQPPTPVAPRRNYADLAASLAPPKRRNGHHPIRRFFGIVVLLGLLGAGLFAAKYYFLDQRWSGEVKPLAAEVETARGLSFHTAVKVATLPALEYSTKLIDVTLGIDSSQADTVAGEWRALGLLSGTFDLSQVGLAALADAPAFYDAGAETIYVVDGLPTDLRRFAIQRSLALALLDQEYGWSTRIAHASPSVVRGTRALYEADALAIATSLLDDSERVNVLTQQQALYSAYQIPVSTVPFATTASNRMALALRPYFDGAPSTTRDAVERNALINDGQALDVRRLVSGVAETAEAQSQGMFFWYHVLASRVDADAAWRAALAWRGDSVSVVRGTSGVCVTALVQIDPASFDGAAGVFQAWAAGAPAESNTSVTAVPGGAIGQLTVTACDPGEAVATNDGRVRLSLGGAPLRAEQYRQLQIAYPQLSPQQLACAVYGADAVTTADERSLIDPVGGWAAVAAHPAADPNAAGCVGVGAIIG